MNDLLYGSNWKIFLRWKSFFLLATVLASSCATSAENRIDDVEPDLILPLGWHNQIEEGTEITQSWCHHYNDPVLAALIEEVLDRNLDLRIAEERLRGARAVLTQQRSARLPRLTLGADAEWERGPQGWEPDFEVEAPLMSYEVDLWGRIRDQVQAAKIELEAAQKELSGLRITISATTAELYFELARVRSQVRLLEEQTEIAKTFLELTHVRHRQGMANAIDVVQQRQQIEALGESLLRARLAETNLLHSIGRLLGEPPGTVEIASAQRLPDSLPGVSSQMPADLLERRPDVIAARMRVAAADYRVDAALKERLPRLNLSVSLFLEAASLPGLVEFLFVNVAGGLGQSLFEGGRLVARHELELSNRERLLLDFSAVLLDAIIEVEEALVLGATLVDIQRTQRLQLENAWEALDLAREQYRAGILDYLRVLTALQSVQRLELAVLNTRRDLLSQRIQLCRAMGGGWPNSGEDEENDG